MLTLILAFNGGGYEVVVRQEVGLAVWALIALGIATGLLPRSRLTPVAWAGLGGFAALAGLTLLAVRWTGSDERTTEEFARVLQYTGVIVLAYLALNRYTWQGAAMGFAVAALVLPFFAIGARLFPGLLTDEVARALRTDRLSYPLDYWNAVSCWAAMAVATGVALSANSGRTLIRSAALATVPVAFLSVYLTYSRFGVAALMIAIVAAVALSRNRWTAGANAGAAGIAAAILILIVRGQGEIAHATGNGGAAIVVLAMFVMAGAAAGAAVITSRSDLDHWRMERQSAQRAVGAAAAGVVLIAAALHGPLGRAWDEFKNDKPPASAGTSRLGSFGSTRHEVWSTAVDAFQSDPSRGIGPGTFEYYWSQHGTAREFVRDAHSVYLEEAAELGIPGLLALLTGLAGLLLAALRARMRQRDPGKIAASSATIAAFIVFLAYAGIDWMWEVGAVGTLALGGAAAAGAGGFERAPKLKLSPWVRAATAVALALVAAVQVPGLVSTERNRASGTALASGDLERARDLADQAITAEPWAASPYAERALVLESEGALVAAERDAKRAIDREPENWRHHLLLAQIYAERGNRPGVGAELAELRRLSPLSPYLPPTSPYRQQLRALLVSRGAARP